MTLIDVTTFGTDPGLFKSNQDPWDQPTLLSRAINEQRAGRPKRLGEKRREEKSGQESCSCFFNPAQ